MKKMRSRRDFSNVNSDARSALASVRARRIDTSFMSADKLDAVARTRLSALPWRGQFTPNLVEELLRKHAPDEGVIFDPFMGSGTTIVEAYRRLSPSLGVEVNPAAVSLARVHELVNLANVERRELVVRANREVAGVMTAKGAIVARMVESVRSNPELAALLVPTFLLSMGNLKQTTREKLLRAWNQIDAIISAMPAQPVNAHVRLGDARATTLPDASVAMVVTSPPYINVFNYHQNYRPAVEMLGWDVLPAARTEIGSNRKHRGNRFMTVVQYAEDIAQAILEIARVAKPNAPVCVVVGRESRVRGVPFANGDIFAAAVELVGGLEFVRWQERKFVSRFGETVYEEVFTFIRTDEATTDSVVADARSLGVEVLVDALRDASPEIALEIKDAIDKAPGIAPSPPPTHIRSGELILA